jgi:Protein of unknown function (DUF3631)
VSEVASALEAVSVFIRRFVVMSDEQATALALWAFHTHAFGASDYTPYIFVTSAERESGKSLLKEVLELLVANPVSTSNVSPAALFRIASPKDEQPATFLVDEVDEIFAPKSERSELRGLLNAGFRRGDAAIRMVGEGARQVPQRFSVYCPKLLAGKNSAVLGGTLESRCIRIELKRKTRSEVIERFRRRQVEEEAGYLAQALHSLGSHYLGALSYAQPELPEELSDRQQDMWEPLFAIADLAGDGWDERARAAAVVLSTGDESDESLGVHLLGDCREVFNGFERVSTARLIELLCLIEEAPWAEKWWDPYKGEPKHSAPSNLAWHLRRYGVRSKTLRLNSGERLKGYERERFEDAWSRYLPPNPDLSRDSRDNPHEHWDCAPSASRDIASFVTAPEGGSNPHEYSYVTGVTAETCLEGNGGPANIRLGDEMFPVLLAEAVRDGHITHAEAEERFALHKLVTQADNDGAGVGR